MTRTTKLSHEECKAELSLMVIAAHKEFGTHAFACGYMESMLAAALSRVSKSDQEAMITSIRNASVLKPK